MFRYFTKRQRIGILILFFLVFLIQMLLIIVSKSNSVSHQLDKKTLAVLEKEYDSLHQNALKEKTPKHF